jgi:hypothetical protein
MCRTTRALAALAVAALWCAAFPGTARAHPSDLGTLTLDLLLDRGGVVLVDAAANRTSYADGPDPAERGRIAADVLAALGVAPNTAEVDAATSLLYHEVGFTAWLHDALANTGVPGEVRLDTRPLQDIAAAHAGRLRLDVCRVASSPDQRVTVQATSPASPPDPAGAGNSDWDRRDCAAWSLAPDDPSVTITARVEGSTSSPAPRALRLPCGPPSDLDPRAAPVLAAFGFVGGIPLHARATGDVEPASRLVAQTFVFVLESHRVTLSIPRAWRGRVRIGSREQRATERASVQCPDVPDAHAWRPVVLTFGVDEPACVPLAVTVRSKTRTVRVGVGARCPDAAASSEARGR